MSIFQRLFVCALAFSVFIIGDKSVSYAQSLERFYVEGNVGLSFPTTVSSNAFSGNALGVTFTNAVLNAEYGSAFTFGAEVGTKVGKNFRFGVGAQSIQGNTERISGSGTVTVGATTVNLASLSLSRQQLIAAGATPANLDGTNTLYAVNGYYDFDSFGAIRPFVGAGLGFVDFQNAPANEFAFSLMAGARYSFTDRLYGGLKVGLHRVSGPTDTFGVAYQDFTSVTAGVILGMEF